MDIKLSRLTWALDNYFIKDQPLSLKECPYMVDLYLDEHPLIVCKKASQSFFSEWAIVDTLYCCDKYGARIAYYLPTDKDAIQFSKDRINSAISYSPYIKKLTTLNDVHLKHVGKGAIYVRGCKITQPKQTTAPSSVISIPIDVLIRDEEDLMNPNIIALTEKRLGASNLKYQRILSNPSTPGHGIDKLFNESDKREWFIKCEHCNHWQVPAFPDNINFEKEIFICAKCKKLINRLSDGEWVAEFRNKDMHGYHVSRLINPKATIKEIITESKKTSESDIQTFFNMTLGLARAAKGAKTDRQLIIDCIKPDYTMPDYSKVDTTAGIDVGNLFHIRISQIIDNKRKAVYIGAVKRFEEVIAVLKRFKVKTIVIDALPETRKAKELADTFKGRVYLAYFSSQKDLFTTGTNAENYKQVNIARTEMMDLLFTKFQDRENILPNNIESVADYIPHILAVSRTLEKDKNNNEVANWTSQGADHYWLAELYDLTASLLYTKKTNIVFAMADLNQG